MYTVDNLKSQSQELPSRQAPLTVNAMSNLAALGISLLVTFFLTPYLIHKLGDTKYGIWALIGSIVGIYGLLDLGISSAIMRYVAYYLGRNDDNSLSKTLSSSLFLFCCVGIVCLTLSFLLPSTLAAFFNLSNSSFVVFKHSLWLIGLATAVSFPSNVLETGIRAYEHFAPTNYVRISTELLRACFCVIALKLELGLSGIAGATFATTAIGFLCNIVLFKYRCPQVRIGLNMINWGSLRELIAYGVPATVVILASILQNKLGNVVIAKYLNMRLVTVYAVGALLIVFLQRFMVAVIGVLDPRFSRLSGQSDSDSIGGLYLRSLAFSTSLAFSIGLTFVLIGRVLIPLWVGPGYEGSYNVLLVLAIGQMVSASQMPTISVLFALNRHRWYAVLSLLEGVVNVCLSIILAQKWGIVGVAAGTTIPILFFRTTLIPLYAIKQVGISAQSFYRTVGRPLVLLVSIGALVRCFFNPVHLSWFQATTLSFASIIILVAVSNWLGISREHRFTGEQIRRLTLRMLVNFGGKN
jgi:O-antigen/teichoic acid export membrane protein